MLSQEGFQAGFPSSVPHRALHLQHFTVVGNHLCTGLFLLDRELCDGKHFAHCFITVTLTLNPMPGTGGALKNYLFPESESAPGSILHHVNLTDIVPLTNFQRSMDFQVLSMY